MARTKKVAIVMALITSATSWKVMMGEKVLTTDKVMTTDKVIKTEKVMTREKVTLMEKVALLTIHWINPRKYLLLKNYESPLCLSFPEKELPYVD